MTPPSEASAQKRVYELLREWGNEREVQVRWKEGSNSTIGDFIIGFRNETLIGVYRRSSDVPTVARAIEKLQQEIWSARAHPLLIVPYMGEIGAERCRQQGVGWMDLSGNAHLRTESFFIHVEGKPNQFKERGRPANVFAPKSSRISRFLLVHPNDQFTQKEISERTGVGPGWTSKVIRRLEEQNLVERRDDRRVEVANPALLLDAWHEKYAFTNHEIVRGTVASRDSVDLTRQLASSFESANVEYAATGLSAAWLLTRFAQFRIVTFYLDGALGNEMKRDIGLREDPKGANVWLVTPNDEGVFYGTSEREDIRCAHPVQVYLDLKGHPERSEEAAQSIRTKYLSWGTENE